MKILKKIFTKLITVLVLIWSAIAFVPLLIGIFMLDFVLSMMDVEEHMLLGKNLSAWLETISVYLKLSKEQRKMEKNNNV